eukprot:m.541753 g.541753  ORF g.541753 m.541753 type:complete len:216 (-) comp22111_c1_seq26:1196-1843(-)
MSALSSVLVLSLVSAAAGVERFSVHGKIIPPPDAPSDFGITTKVVLGDGEHVGFLRKDLSFSINDIPSASYTIEVRNPEYQYEIFRVDLSSKFPGGVRIARADFLGGLSNSQQRIPYNAEQGIILRPVSKVNYFQEREKWSIRSVLFNPMFLMMLLPMGMMYLMPKMMEGMDKEQLAEMQKQQAAMQGNSGFDLAGALAGYTSGAGDTKSRKKKN